MVSGSRPPSRLRICLTAGAYLLTFEFVPSESPPALADIEIEASGQTVVLAAEPQGEQHAVAQFIPEADAQHLITAQPKVGVRSANKWLLVAAVIVAGVSLVSLSLRNLDAFQSRNYLVWKPLLNSGAPLTLSIAETPSPISDTSLNSQSFGDTASKSEASGAPQQDTRTFTPVAYAVVSQNITDWLAIHGQKSILRGSSEVSLQDLRQGPVVLIGGFNPWSLRLLSKLRYSVRVDPAMHSMWIQDAQNTLTRDWVVDGRSHPNDIDYAVISRFIDPDTGNWILSLGGLREQGTEAAKDLLIDASYEKLLPNRLGSKGNFQILLKTNIINGCAGPPQVLAVHTW